MSIKDSTDFANLAIFNESIPQILPHDVIYSITVGGRLFKLSGASLSSDAPSYFTQFFSSCSEYPEEERPVPFLDRSPEAFKAIASHLQGYRIFPDDEQMFIQILSDAHYYHLPKLIRLLETSDIYFRVGMKSFRIPRRVLDVPGNKHNFINMTYRTFLESAFKTVDNMKRPLAVTVPRLDRSCQLFEEILTLMTGGFVEIKNEQHRRLLIKECQYYRFQGLVQQLLPHKISSDDTTITLVHSDLSSSAESFNTDGRVLQYKRPYIDETYRDLIFQVNEPLKIYHDDTWRMDHNDAFAFLQKGPGITIDVGHLLTDAGTRIDVKGYSEESVVPKKRRSNGSEADAIYADKTQWQVRSIEGIYTLFLLQVIGSVNQSCRVTDMLG